MVRAFFIPVVYHRAFFHTVSQPIHVNEHVPVICEDNLKRSRGYQCDGLAKNPGQEDKNTSVCLPHATEIIPVESWTQVVLA